MAGPQSYLVELCSKLKKFKPVVIMPNFENQEFKRRLLAENINFKEININRPHFNLFGIIRYGWTLFSDVRTLMTIFTSTKPSLIYCAGGSWQIKAAIASILSGNKFVWQLNDTSIHALIRHVFKQIAKKATGIIFVSAKTKSYYQNLLDPNIKNAIIQSPINVTKFKRRNISNKKFIDNKNAKNNRTYTIGTICNINPVKDLILFINICNELKKRESYDKQFRFLVVGPINKSQKEYFKKLKSHIDDLGLETIEFTGGSSDVREWLEIIDVYICSSKNEASPISVWEAMSYGIPILTTDVADLKSVLNQYKAGYIIENRSSKSGADIIFNFVINPSLYHEMSFNSREAAINLFSAKQCALKHEKFLNTLLK